MIEELKMYIDKIKDQEIKEAVFAMLEYAPSYFWKTAASSTGKYHSSWSLGNTGLQRHTVFAMHMVIELSRTYGLNQEQTDIALAATALHDTTKYGVKDELDYDYFSVHPYTVRSYYTNYKLRPKLKAYINKLEVRGLYTEIMHCVEKHMGCMANGSWNPLGLKPEYNVEAVVHLADYIASRKEVSFTLFEKENNS
jgi:23S rRNA maturation-related 3'-5' exoribonuclease YhaM